MCRERSRHHSLDPPETAARRPSASFQILALRSHRQSRWRLLYRAPFPPLAVRPNASERFAFSQTQTPPYPLLFALKQMTLQAIRHRPRYGRERTWKQGISQASTTYELVSQTHTLCRSLIRRIRFLHAYGPPGWGEDPKHDEHIVYWAIDLPNPINTPCTPEHPESDSTECEAAKRLRLVIETNIELVTEAKKLVGRRARVTETLHRRDTIGEMTPMFLFITELSRRHNCMLSRVLARDADEELCHPLPTIDTIKVRCNCLNPQPRF